MAVILGEHQRSAISRMKDGCILCGGVGSGKSRTALAYFYQTEGGKIFADGRCFPPKSKRDLYIITTAQKRDKKEWDEEIGYFLMYDDIGSSIHIDSWNNIKKYAGVKNSFFILDEQRLVGNGVWVKSFLQIAKSNRWILLSATPGDKWEDYVPVFIANGFFRNRTEFFKNHAVFSRFSKYPKIDRYLNTARLIRLRDSILIDMPVKKDAESHHIDILCNHDRLAVKEFLKSRWDPYKNVPIENAGSFNYVYRKIVNSDPDRVVKILEIFEKKERVIIFYNYDYELEILRGTYFGEGVEVAEWNGWKHQEIPTSEKWVYLVQYTAGCEGWNCIKTDTIIFFSQNYSYRVMVQAAGRIDRLNTPFTDLYFYHLKSSAKIDLMIERAVKAKKKFNEGRFYNNYIKSFGG